MIAVTSFAQDVPTVISTERISKSTAVEQYDSLSNISEKNAHLLVGQYLYFLPNTLCQKEGSYNNNIYTKRPDGSFISGKENIYQPAQVHYCWNTSYAGVVQKKFKIVDCLTITHDELPYCKDDVYLVLQNPIDNSNLYFKAESYNENKTSYIILGYYEKLKQLYIGKTYKPKMFCALFSLDSNELVRNNVPEKLECVDVTFLDKQWSPAALVLKGNDDKSYYVELERLNSSLYDLEAYNAEKAAKEQEKAEFRKKMIAKYGSVNGKLIADGKVKVGFTKQMCIDAWGEPDKINYTTNKYGKSEQWVYDYSIIGCSKSYLYFSNGKLTTIQE